MTDNINAHKAWIEFSRCYKEAADALRQYNIYMEETCASWNSFSFALWKFTRNWLGDTCNEIDADHSQRMKRFHDSESRKWNLVCAKVELIQKEVMEAGGRVAHDRIDFDKEYVFLRVYSELEGWFATNGFELNFKPASLDDVYVFDPDKPMIISARKISYYAWCGYVHESNNIFLKSHADRIKL